MALLIAGPLLVMYWGLGAFRALLLIGLVVPAVTVLVRLRALAPRSAPGPGDGM